MLKPLFNNVMIELIDDFAGIQRADGNEQLQKGVLVEFQLISDHLTASTGHEIQGIEVYTEELRKMIGKVVYYQEYADSGSVIEYDGKKYAMVPFYRLIGFEE